MGGRRVVVAGGAVMDVIETGPRERAHLVRLEAIDRAMTDLREKLRRGGRIDEFPSELLAVEAIAWTR